MNIGEVVKGIVSYLFEDAVSSLVEPLFSIIELIALSPDTLAKLPYIDTLFAIVQGIGAGTLILVTSWQVLKSMFMGLGIEAEEPQKVAVKAFIGMFLIFYIKDILIYFVGVGSGAINIILDISNTNLKQLGMMEIVMNVKSGGFIYVIILIYLIFKFVELLFRMFERLAMCSFLLIVSPLAVAAMVSKPTEGFWQGFSKLFVGNIIIQLVQSLCFAAVIVTLNQFKNVWTGGLGVDIFYMMLSCAIVNVANKLEDIVRDISMSVGIGRDMGGALNKVQSVMYTASMFGRFGK